MMRYYTLQSKEKPGVQISGATMFRALATSSASENSGVAESHIRIAWTDGKGYDLDGKRFRCYESHGRLISGATF